MDKPMPTDEETAKGEGGDMSAQLDKVEASAWADMKAAISSDDDESGITALRDFIRACMKREAAEEYTEEG